MKNKFMQCATIMAAAIIAVCCINSPLPRVNNSLAADKLVTRYYSDEELSRLQYASDNYLCVYENTSELARDFKIECLRDPAQLVKDSSYRPYIVLLGSSGKRAFIMLDYYTKKNEYIINSVIVIDQFMSHEEMEKLLAELDTRKAVWEEWYELLNHTCGNAGGNLVNTFPLTVSEGVVYCTIYHCFKYGEDSWGKIIRSNYYSDDELFSENALLTDLLPNDIWPYLPIDKVW